MSEILPLAEVKAHLSEIIEKVYSEHERILVTRNGRPAAVIMSPEDLDSLEETLDILLTPGALEEIHSAKRDIKSGNYLTAAELRAKYLEE